MMRKIRLLLAISLFTAGSLNPVAADSAQPEDRKAFSRILSQLQLNEEKVDTGFVTSRVVPSDETRTIWVIPTIPAREGGTPSEPGCCVLLADTKKGRIISRCYYPQIWNSESGYAELREIGIDTLGYRLHSDGFTFGVRSSQRIGSSRTGHYDQNTVGLFVCHGDSLQYVFGYNDLECTADQCPDGGWEHVRTDRRLMPLTGMSEDGFYYFALLSEKKTLKDDLIDSTSIRTFPPRVFVYAGNSYMEVLLPARCQP